MSSDDCSQGDERRCLSSEALAALVIDALVDAGFVRREDAERAIRIVTEEIDVRKAMGDYWIRTIAGLVVRKVPILRAPHWPRNPLTRYVRVIATQMALSPCRTRRDGQRFDRERRRGGLSASQFARPGGFSPRTLFWWASRVQQRSAALRRRREDRCVGATGAVTPAPTPPSQSVWESATAGFRAGL